MEDKAVDFTKPAPEPEYPPVNRSVPRCFLLREAGFMQKTNAAPPELQWAAEDKMVLRKHEEFRCQLPDVSRSTFLMVFSPDGKKVASTHGNHNVYVTDLNSGKNIKTLSGHPRTPWCIAFHPSSNQILASGCLGGQVRVWDLSGGSEIWMAESQTVIASLAFHPIDRMLVIASYNELHFWDWSQPEPFAKCFTANEKEKVRYVAFDALGHKLITGVANAPTRHVSQWDRVAAPQPSPQASQLESERRITICYRYMVEQYEQLVQRYRDLTRARSTLTMDRGTDPMEFEGESSDSQNAAQNASRPPRPRAADSPARASFLVSPPRPRQSSGTDETSASHSSTNFLTPPEPIQSDNRSVTQPPLTSSSDPTPNTNQPNSATNRTEPPRRNPRFDITLPSFSSFRSRSSSVPGHNHSSSSPYHPPLHFCPRHQQDPEWPGYLPGTPLARFTLSPDAVNFNWNPSAPNRQNNQTESGQNTPAENNSPSTPNTPPSRRESTGGNSVQQIFRNLMTSWYNRNEPSGDGTSTEVNSAVESEEQEPSFQEEPHAQMAESEPPVSAVTTGYIRVVPNYSPTSRTRSVFRNADVDSETDDLDDFRASQASHQQPPNQDEVLNNLAGCDPPELSATSSPATAPRSPSPAPRSSRISESAARRFSEATAVSQLRSQFHRLQSVYENRNSGSNSHVFSPESQACERRLLNRINEILERPLPELRTRRLFPSRRSAFQSRPPPPAGPTTSEEAASTTSPDIIGGVQYGIQLLSQHIDNMQRLCRARLEILQLQQIRRMWEDLQSQIHALHGAVRDGRADEDPPRPATTTGTAASTGAAASTGTAASTGSVADLLTDDDSDGPSNNGEVHWRMRRTPQTSRRNAVKTSLPRTPNRNLPMKRSRLTLRANEYSRRMSMLLQMETNRRQLNRQASSSTQATSEERGEASSSHVSADTSTGTGTGSDEQGSVRGVKRKSRDTDPLFRPRASSSQDQGPSGTGASASTSTSADAPAGGASTGRTPTTCLAAMMRETIVQLENMVWRHRQSNSQRNTRLNRFTRQREERMMRNLWDTESSHESGRDDQSEGDNTPQSEAGEADVGDTEWTRDTTRMRARQVLLLMVDSLTQFFENDNLIRRSTNEALNDRIQNLYVLLQLALNLTDLLLAQLVNSRRELEARRPAMLDHPLPHSNWMIVHNARHARRSVNRQIRRTSLAWRRILRRAAPPTSPSTSPPPSPDQPRRPPTIAQPPPPAPPNRHYMMHRPHSFYYNLRSAMLSHYQPRPLGPVPIVRVNDLPPPPPEANASRFRPHSPPPMAPHPMFPRFLHPGRYPGGNFMFDESTSEDSSPHDRSSDFFFMRAGYGSSSVILTDTPMSPHHRIQAWDFSKFKLPDLGNADKNIVVSECKIHNDASVDMSKDGRLLVTLLSSGRLSMTTLLGIYSLQWDTLGQLLYTTSFEQSIVSVSLSPTSRHLVVGLASRRIALVSTDRHTNAQIFRLEGASPGRKAPLGARGRLVHLRDLELSRHLGFMSLNCIRWAPNPGQGLVYGTNTGQLKILR